MGGFGFRSLQSLYSVLQYDAGAEQRTGKWAGSAMVAARTASLCRFTAH